MGTYGYDCMKDIGMGQFDQLVVGNPSVSRFERYPPMGKSISCKSSTPKKVVDRVVFLSKGRVQGSILGSLQED